MKDRSAHQDMLISDPREIRGRNNYCESGTWSEVFGEDADEVFSAWSLGRSIGRVAAAGNARLSSDAK